MSTAQDERPAAPAPSGLERETLAALRRVANGVLALTHMSSTETIDIAEADYAMEVRADRVIRLLNEVEAARRGGG